MSKGKMRKAVLILTTFLVAAGAFTTASAAGKISIFVNSKPVQAEAKVINGKVYIPLEAVGETLGAEVSWNPESKTVSVVSEETGVSEVISKMSASVVGIIGKLKPSSQNYSNYSDNLVFGSGVIYKSNGFIVTNAHVVSEMESIVVVLSNGKAYNARLKAMDEACDLAVIKIDKGQLTPAVFGSMTDVVVGKQVVAIGTPLSFSLRNSATKGIISGLNRSADGEYRFIQSDAAINGGNSGGPLVDLQGHVIGINTVKYVGFGVEGMSFSIPIDTVKYVLDHFEKYGKVRRPYLGVQFMEGVAARYGLPSGEGLTVSQVIKDSPAEKAGLKSDDIIRAVNGAEVTTKIDYNEEMKKYLPGSKAELAVERDGKALKIKVTFGENK